jgi:hypothetical protein
MSVLLAWPARAKLTRRAKAFVDFCHRTLASGPVQPGPW